ncbi:MAG: class I SAM-dependent methyltransferase [Patescibacteria group bacterium]|nr:class I SAM-dependent methyltransferase [Patescibacteria group bacterium]
MSRERHLITESRGDYELLDSGENMKLERFGAVVVARPETQALWKKAHPERWNEASAIFRFRDKQGGWEVVRPLPEPWEWSGEGVRARLRLTGFKHTGIFPEQTPNWEWSKERIDAFTRTHGRAPNVLNLFAYTGIASIVAAGAGAAVTHVDASKQSLDWAHENARLSGIPEDGIRWMLDDAAAFAKREARRGNRYDGIILDPPAFGRGAKGEVWKIEESLPALLETLAELFSGEPGSFFLANGYAAGYAPASFLQAAESAFGDIDAEYGELHIKESGSERVVPAGMYVRFTR